MVVVAEELIPTYITYTKRHQPQCLTRATQAEPTLTSCPHTTLLAQQAPTTCRPSASFLPPQTSTRNPSSKSSSSMRYIKRTSIITLKSLPWIVCLNRNYSCNNSRWWCARSNSVSMSNKVAWLAHSRWFCSNSTILVEQIQRHRLVVKTIQGQGLWQV